MHTVVINDTGEIREFETMDKAVAYQEYCVFVLGLDAEVQS